MTTEGDRTTVDIFFHCSLAGLTTFVDDLDNDMIDFLWNEEENSFRDRKTGLGKNSTGILVFMGLIHLLYVAMV